MKKIIFGKWKVMFDETKKIDEDKIKDLSKGAQMLLESIMNLSGVGRISLEDALASLSYNQLIKLEMRAK